MNENIQAENTSVDVPVAETSATENTDTVVDENVTTSTTVDEPSNWFDGFSDELKSSEGFDGIKDKFKDVESLAQSYINLQKLVGKKTESGIPGEDATPEQLDEFYSKLGRPETAGDYKWNKPLENFEFDSERLTERNAQLHEVGITDTQYNKIMDIYADEVLNLQNEWQQTESNVIEESRSALQKEWGDDYDRNIGYVGKIAEKFGVKDALVESGTINQLPVIQMLWKVHEATQEDGIVKVDDSGYSKSEEIKLIQNQMTTLPRGSAEYQKLWAKLTKLRA